MAFEFHLPDIGEGLVEATIVSWRVAVGDRIGLDEPLVEVETDKAVVEIPAPRAGVVLHLGAANGETVVVDSLLVVIGAEGEEWSGPDAPKVEERAAEVKPIVGDLEPVSRPASDRLRALPLVRRLAESLNVDLSTVAGTGPAGRILRADVESAAAGKGPFDRVRMSPTRLAIARNLSRSWQEIPHVTTFAVADPTSLMQHRSGSTPTGAPLPLEALLIAAVTPLLADFPEFNASVDGDHILLRRHYDIGFAVDTPDGLVVAVVKASDVLDVAGLAAEVERLATAARTRTIAAGDLRGATFTVSNIGAVGGGFGTPIIPYGTTAILSVGRAAAKPVVVDGELAVGQEMPLSLSYDQRVIDGATGRAFLAGVVAALEDVD